MYSSCIKKKKKDLCRKKKIQGFSTSISKMSEKCEKRKRREETLLLLQEEIALVLESLKKKGDGEETPVHETRVPVLDELDRHEVVNPVQVELRYEEQIHENNVLLSTPDLSVNEEDLDQSRSLEDLGLDDVERQGQEECSDELSQREERDLALAIQLSLDYSELNVNVVETSDQQSEENGHYQELLDLETLGYVPNTDPFECSICFDTLESYEGVILRDCLHTFCKDCLSRTIELNEAAEVKCPYVCDDYACDSILQDREVKSIVSEDIYQKHLAKSVAQAEYKMNNTFHCKTADCRGWCVFEDDVNAFFCPVCQMVNCLSCQVIHEGKTCKQYQEDLKRLAETDADARRTKEALEEMLRKGDAMACPTCQILIMLKEGCDWVKCTMCQTEICWATRGPRWGPLGHGDVTGGCRCRVGGKLCQPRCRNCH